MFTAAPVWGDYNWGSCVTVAPNNSAVKNLTVDKNWFNGGQFSVQANATNTDYGWTGDDNIVGNITNNRFQHDQHDAGSTSTLNTTSPLGIQVGVPTASEMTWTTTAAHGIGVGTTAIVYSGVVGGTNIQGKKFTVTSVPTSTSFTTSTTAIDGTVASGTVTSTTGVTVYFSADDYYQIRFKTRAMFGDLVGNTWDYEPSNVVWNATSGRNAPGSAFTSPTGNTTFPNRFGGIRIP